MFVLIGGGGQTATHLATDLLAEGHEVRLIEHRPEVLAYTHMEVPTEVVYEGRPTDPAMLEAACIRQAQVVAACTGTDAENLVLCFMARELYEVPRTIARIDNPRAAWLYNPRFHVDVAVNQAANMASLIMEEMSLGDMMTLLKLRRGQYSLVEEKIPPGARAAGMAIMELPLPESCVIAAIIRRGKVLVPRGITTFAVGDEVLAVVDREGGEALAALFARPAEAAEGAAAEEGGPEAPGGQGEPDASQEEEG